MNVQFYLFRPATKNKTDKKKESESQNRESGIFAWVSYAGQRIRISTGESINPKHWNPEKHEARKTLTEHPEFNERLRWIASQIKKCYLKYKNDNDGAEPNPADLKLLVNETMGGPSKKQLSFFEYFKDFCSRQRQGLRVSPKTGVINAENYKHYQNTMNVLQAFNPKLDFADISLSFYNDFVKHQNSKKVALNTLGVHIQRLKAVLNDAEANGFPVNPDFKSKYFAKMSEEVENIALTPLELADIQLLDLEHQPRLSAVRDLFIIGCYTGLRFGDFSRLTSSHIQSGLITIGQQKTGEPVVIPVHPIVEGIFTKYSGVLPKSASNQKTNEYLKEVGKMVKSMEATESKTTTRGGRKVSVSLSRWEMLTTHTARRTFATIQYNKGVSTLTIMAITGHKTEKAFLKYIKVTPTEHAMKLRNFWADEMRVKMKAV